MDLLKTPSASVQSLLDSDLESIESFQNLDIEELDEIEYALPISESLTLAEVLSADDDEDEIRKLHKKIEEPTTCSALKVDFLQAISQQIVQAQERSSAGAPTAISVGKDGKITVGTAHGHILSFHEQILRWVCDSNSDRGAVSCLAYNHDSTRLLAGYARNLICQYESVRGIVLRRVTLGSDIWGTLKVTWAGTSGVALDTGGSVWVITFSRPLGVRSARATCLFSGARGEVVAMTTRESRILALATLSRVIVVAGGHAAGIRFGGPPDTLPVIEWCESDSRVLVCARAKTLQWISVKISGSMITLRPLQRVELKTTPTWLGWLDGSLAIIDVDENLRIWGDDYDKPLDLSYVEPVYASAFFKGLWTDGRVSLALGTAGASALGGVCVAEGAISLLGRKGIVRVRPRDLLARAQAFMTSGRFYQALRLLCSTKGSKAKELAYQFVTILSERPHVLSDKHVADQAVKLCLKFQLSEELWSVLWESCCNENAFVETLGDAAVRGELSALPPSPDSSQALIERLAEFEPGLVERVVASLPLTSLDPHRASVFTREKRLWRGVGAIAAALGGPCGAMRSLVAHVDARCGRDAAPCACAGGALLLAAADALAGRGAGGRPLPDHAQPSARHDALQALLSEEAGVGGRSPLQMLVEHEAAAAARLLEQSAREPPFAGPLGKQNRLRVARALLAFTDHLQEPMDRIEIIEFIAGQVSSGALPYDQEVIKIAQEVAASTTGERADRAWAALLGGARRGRDRDRLEPARAAAAARPRVLWRIDTLLDRHDDALHHFFQIETPSTSDVDELFEYLQTRVKDPDAKASIEPHLAKLMQLRPRATAAIINDHFPNSVTSMLASEIGEFSIDFGECLLEMGRLKGDAAAEHFRNLCHLRPGSVTAFLAENSGVIRPEDALSIVREAGIADAEPICLEATGDHEGALDAILRLVDVAESRGDAESSARLTLAGGALCARAAPLAPAGAAAALWARLLRRAALPPALLLDALAHLPVADLIGQSCQSASVALTLMGCAATRRRLWAVAARVAGREAHAAAARAVRAAGRALPVRGPCRRCGLRLGARPAVRTGHCARAFHAECEAEESCGACGARLPDALYAFPPRAPAPLAPSADHDLRLVAPPRPDLEGIV